MIENISGLEKSYIQDIIKGISDLVKIPTLYDEETVMPLMPYGRNVMEGLSWIKDRALQDGFEVIEFDGHALAIRIKGKDYGKRIDVVSHVDVVEPGEGWSEDPFSGKISNDFIYGRGTQDMKGPLMVTYYALKYLKDQNIAFHNEVRIVIGADEERTMNDMRYYLEKAGEPDFAFTPDGKFPLSYGEKGALMWVINGEMDTCIKELTGGVKPNVISPMATARIKDLTVKDKICNLLSNSGYSGTVTEEGEFLNITIYGKAAHASTPKEGINATVLLLDILHESLNDPLATLLYNGFWDPWGTGADIVYDIEPMGKLTLNLGILRVRDKQVYAEIDCRYPLGVTADTLTKNLQNALMPLNVEMRYDDKPTLADVNSPYIQLLLDTYKDVTGESAIEPKISGGVTYSKAIRNCVAFGPYKDQDISLAHQADEKISKRQLEELFIIYKEAIRRLAQGQFE